MIRPVLLTCVLLSIFAVPAWAQEVPQQNTPTLNSSAPVEISADKGLVWDRTAHTYTAKGRAEARQGDMKVTSDVLVARYDAAGGSSDIREVTADGHVVLSSPPYTAYGDKAVYDLTSGVAVLTGGDLRVMTPGETLTAKERLTYVAHDGQMTAEGGAKLTRPTDSLEAQTLTADFATQADGSRGLDTVTATGTVTIKTARETITGAKGVYRAATQTAELTGNVVITQGKNRLQGSRATVDMKTGVSQLYGSASEGGRVTGVFYPKGKTAPAASVQSPVRAAAPALLPPVANTPSTSAVSHVPAAVEAAPPSSAAPEIVTQDVKGGVKEQPSVVTPVSPASEKPSVKEPVSIAPTMDTTASQPISPPVDEPFAVPPANQDHSVQPDKPDVNP